MSRVYHDTKNFLRDADINDIRGLAPTAPKFILQAPRATVSHIWPEQIIGLSDTVAEGSVARDIFHKKSELLESAINTAVQMMSEQALGKRGSFYSLAVTFVAVTTAENVQRQSALVRMPLLPLMLVGTGSLLLGSVLMLINGGWRYLAIIFGSSFAGYAVGIAYVKWNRRKGQT